MFDFSFENILHSNLINFLIMVGCFAILIWKLKVGEKIEGMRASIQNKIEESDAIKEEAKKDYQNIADSLANIDSEIEEILKKAEATAKSFEEKARQDLDKSVELIKQNTEKQILTEQNHVQTDLIKNIANSSIEIAQKQIKNALENDKSLHRKYIEECIKSIDKADV